MTDSEEELQRTRLLYREALEEQRRLRKIISALADDRRELHVQASSAYARQLFRRSPWD